MTWTYRNKSTFIAHYMAYLALMGVECACINELANIILTLKIR